MNYDKIRIFPFGYCCCIFVFLPNRTSQCNEYEFMYIENVTLNHSDKAAAKPKQNSFTSKKCLNKI